MFKSLKISNTFFLFLMSCLFNFSLYGQDLEAIKKAKPITWTGSVGTSMTTYSVRGIDRRMNPFHYGFYGNFNISIMEEFDIPISFNYNQFGLDVEKPFYQFGISPKYKSFQLHLGHRNMFFNSYSLAGHTFFGAGFEFNPGKFRFSAMKGKLRDPLILDLTNTQSFTNPQFKRSGWGAKIGVGSFNNHIDLMIFKAQDDPNSLDNWENIAYQNSISGQTGRFAPSENLIFGITSKWTLFSKVIWSIEAGSSLYTDDVTRDSILNENALFNAKSTSTLKWAGKTNLNIPLGPLVLNLGYERISPDYFSMGMYNFINDMENTTISPSLTLFSGRVFMNGMVGIQRNNLEGNRSETTERLINNFSLTITPKPEYGINFNYTNFSFNQQPQAILLNDSLLIKQVNKSMTIMPYYNIIQDSTSQQSINAAFILQDVEDLNPITREFGNMNTKMITTSYSFTNSSGFQIGGGLNYTNLDNAFLKTVLTGVNINLGKNIPKKNIQVNLSNQFNNSNINDENDGFLVSSNLSSNITFYEKHSLRANLNWLRSSSAKYESYNEFIFNLGYNFLIK